MRRPFAINVVAVLAVLYGIVLAGEGAMILFELVTGTGAIGHDRTNAAAVKGMVTVGLLLPAGAVALWTGSARLTRAHDPRLLALPLLAVLLFGSIGETVDLFGTASARSDLIGAGILVLAALPLALLSLPRSRAWLGPSWWPARRGSPAGR